MKSKSKFLSSIFGADTRSLAILRMGLGALVLVHSLLRLRFREAFYSNSGVLPCSALSESTSLGLPYNLYCDVSSDFHSALLLLTALAGLWLMVGYWTRFANALSWYLVVCLQVRNPLAIQGGDLLLRVMLFWSMFLPLGEQWSFDARQRGLRQTRPSRIALNVGTIAFGLQIVFVYVFTVALKLQGDSWVQGSALYYALSIDQLVTPFGHSLLQHQNLLAQVTPLVLLVEAALPLMLYIPIHTWVFRLVAVLGFVAMHVSFLICLNLGPFPWTNLVSFLFFIPTQIWNRLLGSELGVIHSELPAKSARRPPLETLWQVVAVPLLLAVFQWNLSTLHRTSAVPPLTDILVSASRLDQNWDMFAPDPQRDDGWYIFSATLRDGSQRDIFPGVADLESSAALTTQRPGDLSLRYPGERWRKYLINLWTLQDREKYRLLAEYLCRNWNNHGDDSQALMSIELVYMLERTPPPGEVTPIQRISLYQQQCS